MVVFFDVLGVGSGEYIPSGMLELGVGVFQPMLLTFAKSFHRYPTCDNYGSCFPRGVVHFCSEIKSDIFLSRFFVIDRCMSDVRLTVIDGFL